MKKLIYFKGYYGFKNIGDDIFCIVGNWICENVWTGKEAIFIGKELPKEINSSSKREIKNYYIRKIYELLIVFKCNYIVFLGGSLFSRIKGIKDIKYHLNKHKIFHDKIGTIGTSVGPFKEQKDYLDTKDFLSKFRFLSVRDYASLKTLKDMDIKNKSSFSFDLAILIDEIFPSFKKNKINKNNEKIKIAVSLCHYERYVCGDLENEKQREESILNFLNKIVDLYANIEELVFFEFNGSDDKGDMEIIKKFEQKLSTKINTRIISYTLDTESFIVELSKCDFLIGVRLHSAILAYALNIPFMLVEYHKKCTEFLNTINNKYRYYVNDIDKSIQTFNQIISTDYFLNMKLPAEFKEVTLGKVKEIEKDFL